MERAGAAPKPHDDFATTTRFHLVSRYADAVAVLKDSNTFSSALTPDGAEPRLLSELDPPDHGRIRRPMINALGRRTVDGIAPFVRSQCRAIIDAWPRTGQVDLVEDLAVPVLHQTITALVGIPDEDRDAVFGWAAELTYNPFDDADTARTAQRHLDAYLQQMLSTTTSHTVRENASTSFLAASRLERPALTTDEIRVQLRSLIMSGYGATIDLLSILLNKMIVEPGLWQSLNEDRSKLESLLAEALRFDAPAALLNRRCTVDTVLADKPVLAGDVAIIAIGLANHDPDIHDRPEVFDPLRPRPGLHLSFGAGPHTCPGIYLVKMIVGALVPALLDKSPLPPTVISCERGRGGDLFIKRGPVRLVVDMA